MKQKIKISILSILLLSSLSASAFTLANADMFKNPIQKFFDKVLECKWSISCYRTPKVGAFTDITSATVISNFPTVYNANLVKTMEVGTTSVASITTLSGLTTANALASATSLASIGTITTGQWNATAIPVNKGGTGTTSPTQYQVMVGNGSSGLKAVSGLGTSGQFLTSNGAGTDPTWQSSTVNQGDPYTWTGENMWTASSTHSATTTISASSVTNNALVLNGVASQAPSSQGASSTVLTNNGSGVWSWQFPMRKMGVATLGASTASGDLVIAHGLGIIPHRIKLTASLVGSNAAGNLYQSFGGYNGTTNYNISNSISTTAGIGSSDSTYCVLIQYIDGGAYQRGTCAFDATNITISFTYQSTFSGTIRILWEAE